MKHQLSIEVSNASKALSLCHDNFIVTFQEQLDNWFETELEKVSLLWSNLNFIVVQSFIYSWAKKMHQPNGPSTIIITPRTGPDRRLKVQVKKGKKYLYLKNTKQQAVINTFSNVCCSPLSSHASSRSTAWWSFLPSCFSLFQFGFE